MIGISGLLAELEERERERQPCLQTDLALIDILSNRCIHHLNTVMKTANTLNTDVYLSEG